MSVINTNVKSLVAQNALTVNNRSLSKTMEQLSTGKRINSAADDAASGHRQQNDSANSWLESSSAQCQRRHFHAADRRRCYTRNYQHAAAHA